MRLLLDEMLSPRIAVELRDRGYDATAVMETPTLRKRLDDEIFFHAQGDSRVIVTRNIQDIHVPPYPAINPGRMSLTLVSC